MFTEVLSKPACRPGLAYDCTPTALSWASPTPTRLLSFLGVLMPISPSYAEFGTCQNVCLTGKRFGGNPLQRNVEVTL